RAELLKWLGVRFRVAASSAPEVAASHLAPREICLVNAAAKARTVARRFPEHLVLAADTEAALDARVFGKPANRRQAADFLRALSGRTHERITGECLHCDARPLRLSFAECTQVHFHHLSDSQVNAYLRRVNPLDKPGGYAVQ